MAYLPEHTLLDPVFFYKLDGTDSGISITKNTINPPIQEVSGSAKFNEDSLSLPVPTSIIDEIFSSIILWIRPKSGSYNPLFHFSQDEDNYITCYITIANILHYEQVIEGIKRVDISFCLNSNTYCDNRWHTLIITTNALQIDFYIDSVLQKSKAEYNTMLFIYTGVIDEVTLGIYESKYYSGDMALFSYIPEYMEAEEVNEIEKYKFFIDLPPTSYSTYYLSNPYRYFTLEDEYTEWKDRLALEKFTSGLGTTDLALGSKVIPESRTSIALQYNEYLKTAIETTFTENTNYSILISVVFKELDSNIIFALTSTSLDNALILELTAGNNLKTSGIPALGVSASQTGATVISTGNTYIFAIAQDSNNIYTYINGKLETTLALGDVLEDIDGSAYIGGALDIGNSDFDLNSFLLYETDERAGVIAGTSLSNNDDNIIATATSMGAIALYRMDDEG